MCVLVGTAGCASCVGPMGQNSKPAQDASSKMGKRNFNQDSECRLDGKAGLFFSAGFMFFASSYPVYPAEKASFLFVLLNQVWIFCLEAHFVLLLDLEPLGCVNAVSHQGILP